MGSPSHLCLQCVLSNRDNYTMSNEHLILTGFMGMGKSTVGPKVAETLGVNYYDTDNWMETESGVSVPDLVRTDMQAFRKLEAATLVDILELEPGVISTGGGIVSTEVGRKALLASGVPVIWMWANFDVVAKRVSEDSVGRDRPLFDDVEKARALNDERQGWYRETATHTVDASQPIELVTGDIVAIVRAE